MGFEDEEDPVVADDEQPWEPEPISQEAFLGPEGWSNINRAPLDRVSGVIYKRAAHIKRVRYTPLAPSPEAAPPWQGQGEAVVRWLFSEEPGTEEGILQGRCFQCLLDVALLPGAATGQQAHAGQDSILYVLEGQGRLYHRPSASSPVVARPLRRGDAVLISGDELYSVENLDDAALLRMIVLRLG